MVFAMTSCATAPVPEERAASLDEALPASRFLARLWVHPGAFEKVNHVALDDRTLFVAGTPRGVEAINVKDGSWLWRHLGKLLVDEAPTVRGNVVYLVEGGQFVTLDRNNGRELSRNRTRIGTLTPVYAGTNAWVIGATNERIYGITPETGLGCWHITLDSSILDAMWNGVGTFYCRTSRGTLYAASVASKDVTWQYKFPKPDCSPIALTQDALYVGCADYYLYAISAETGDERWKVCLNAPVLGTPVAVETRVYVSTDDGVLHAVDTQSQTVLWRIPNAERVLTTTPKHVIFLRGDEGANVIGVADAETGEVLSQATAFRYEHFVAEPDTGIFFAVAQNGDVLAIADREVAQQQREAEKQARKAREIKAAEEKEATEPAED